MGGLFGERDINAPYSRLGPVGGVLAGERSRPEAAVYVGKLFAGSGHTGPKLQDALKGLGISGSIEFMPRAKGFTVLSRRWVVARAFAWMGRCRRLVKDVREDGGKFSGLGEAGRMSVHGAKGRSASAAVSFC